VAPAVGKMTYPRFALCNVTGGVGWVVLLTLVGRFFGKQPFVKDHFELIIIAIIVLSVVPAAWEFLRARREAKRNPTPSAAEFPD